jgi:predicted amidohydrolase YtcJ
MRRSLLLLIAGCLLAALLVAGAVTRAAGAETSRAGAPPVADTVYTNGVVATEDAAHTLAQAVAVKDGVIVYVGDDAGVAAYVGAGTATVDLGGKFVCPGFVDAHAHPDEAVADLYEVDIYSLHTMAAYQKKIHAFASRHEELGVIQGSGWDTSLFSAMGPTAKELDKACKDRPVVIWDQSYHEMWVNSAALKLAGITSKTKDPEGGVIERYPGTTKPSGVLRESATDLVKDKVPDFTVAQYEAALLHMQRDVLGPLGVTSVLDAWLEPGGNPIAAFEDLAQKGELTVRYRGAIHFDPGSGTVDDQVAAAVAERAKHTSDLFQANTVKFFMDGVVDGHTALLDTPYKDRPNFCGNPVWQWPELKDAAVKAAQHGFQLHFHAIGDAACSMALNAVQAAETATGNGDPRDGITHLQLVTPTDYQRMAQLGVVAVTQPYWFVKDSYYWDLQLPFLGKWRADHEYPMKSFFDNGVKVCTSSDYPVTVPPDPLQAIQTGVTRYFRGASEWSVKKNDPLWIAQKVNVQQMLDASTINGAYSMYLDGETGSIEVGKSADFIVLSKDILTCPTTMISKAAVMRTVFRGQTVYDRQGDLAVKEGIHSIQVGIQSWAVDHGDKYPDSSVVTAAGLAMYVDNWPNDPWTGLPMTPGTAAGEFTYTQLDGGNRFTLAGHLSGGKDYVVP